MEVGTNEIAKQQNRIECRAHGRGVSGNMDFREGYKSRCGNLDSFFPNIYLLLLTFKEERDVATAVQEILIRCLLLQRTD